MSHLTQRFEAAVRDLAAADGPIKQRLITAYAEHLEYVEARQLPKAVRSNFRDLHAALHCVPAVGAEPLLRATVRKLSGREAHAYAVRIVQIYTALLHEGETELQTTPDRALSQAGGSRTLATS